MIKDISIADGRPAPHIGADWARGKSGRLVLVNGQLRPRHPAQAPLVRLRLINACNARMLLLARADGRPLQVIAHDGHLLEAPQPLAEVLLTPAQRLDLLLALDGRRAGRAAAQALQSRRPARALARRDPAQRAPAAGRIGVDAWPARLAAVERLDPQAVAVRRQLQDGDGVPRRRTASGQLAPIEARLGDLELWEITNVDTQDHVFHLHTWPFQVWRRDGVALADPGWRDTINLVPGERVEILIPFRDFAGQERLPLPHRRAWRCRHDGHHRGARARQRRAAAPCSTTARDLPLRLILASRRWQACIRSARSARGAQLADQPRSRLCALAVSGCRRAAPTSAAV